MSDDAAFHLEALKLLMQIAFADGTLTERERAIILSLGRRWRLDDAAVHALVRAQPLPAPNLAILRPRKAEVLTLAKTLATADHTLGGDEKELMDEIDELLGT
jgi:uncharacterized tellurite resistance protein B-like protein